jgi:hypothetical protein
LHSGIIPKVDFKRILKDHASILNHKREDLLLGFLGIPSLWAIFLFFSSSLGTQMHRRFLEPLSLLLNDWGWTKEWPTLKRVTDWVHLGEEGIKPVLKHRGGQLGEEMKP